MTTITVTAISELQNGLSIVVDMIDALASNARWAHALVPFRLFKKTVSKAAASNYK